MFFNLAAPDAVPTEKAPEEGALLTFVMSNLFNLAREEKPLAGSCRHQWQNQESPFLVAQVCQVCQLFRYKTSLTADWEYRAPIPLALPPTKP